MVSPKKNTAKAPVNSGQFIVNFDPFGIESAAEKNKKKQDPTNRRSQGHGRFCLTDSNVLNMLSTKPTHKVDFGFEF